MTAALEQQWVGTRPDGRPDAVPRFATPRNPDRKTLGGMEAQCAARLGTPFMPWQAHAADLAMEIDPATGRLAYSEVIVLAPRQQGKTAIITAKSVHRAFGFPPVQSIVYVAQTRGAARRRWSETFVPAIQASMFAPMIKEIRLANDSEAVVFRNRARLGIESGTQSAGHGGTNSLGILDEAWAFVDSRQEQAILPTMLTVPDAQLYIMSTAGNSSSLYLAGKVARGRERVESGEPSRTAFIEFSAGDDDDPTDPETWYRCMPALGYTVTEDAVRSALDVLGPDEFSRAMLNRPAGEVTEQQVIDAAAWAAAADPGSKIAGGRTFSLDVTPDRSYSTLAVAGDRADGLTHIEVVKHDRGTAWVPAELARLTTKYGPTGPVIICGAAAAALQGDLAVLEVDSLIMSLADQRAACAQLFDSVPTTVRHIGQGSLDAALAGARKADSSGTWTWSRKSRVDISPLWAVTGAAWGWRQGSADPLDSIY